MAVEAAKETAATVIAASDTMCSLPASRRGAVDDGWLADTGWSLNAMLAILDSLDRVNAGDFLDVLDDLADLVSIGDLEFEGVGGTFGVL